MTPLPSDFITRCQADLTGDESAALFQALDSSAPTSVRLNPMKSADRFASEDVVPWCDQGKYLETRPSFTLDPLFHAGAYYPQEASSMIIGEIVRMLAPRKALDLCAAPGGKSTHLSAVIPAQGMLVANEVIRPRAQILAENVQKWGAGNTVVTNSDPKAFANLPAYFDLVLVDAPCSGEGMFRKDPDSRAQWTVENTHLCAARSRRIVADVWNALAEGGTLIYSTCTYNTEENEGNIRWICQELGAEPMEIQNLAIPQGVLKSAEGMRFYPHQVKGEGFFCSVLRKISGCEYTAGVSKKRPPLVAVSKAEAVELNKWVQTPLQYAVGGGSIYGYTPILRAEIDLLLATLSVVYSGVQMGEIIHGELKPAHALALYHQIDFAGRSELPLEEALAYLRKTQANIAMYHDGLALVTHQNIAIGWAKKITARVNNNYPPHWRIRI